MDFVLKLSTELQLSRPITGSEVVDVVGRLVDKANARKRYTFYLINALGPDHPGRMLVGQASNFSWHHLLVTDPDSDVDGLLADTIYKKLLIRTYRWPGATKMILEDEPAKKLAELLDFTSRFSDEAKVLRPQLARL